jgi:hypothetical protein
MNLSSSGCRSPRTSGKWACGAAGSALPWHGRGRRFDPDQVHHSFQFLTNCPTNRLVALGGTLQKHFSVSVHFLRLHSGFGIDRVDGSLHAFRIPARTRRSS